MHKVVDEIVTSNEWRDGEFAKLKVGSIGLDDALWCRMCIPMIYAHWEGYVVTSLKILIDYLNSLSLSVSEVPTKLVVVGLGDAYKTLSGKQSFGQRVDFTNKFFELLKATVKFKKKIDTRSNLKSDVLLELCDMYGFNFERFYNVSADIDRLVNIRNSIAHGENSIVPSKDNVLKYISSVTEAMDTLRDEIDRFLICEEYRVKLAG
jgi:hypothetical protein